MTQQGDLVKLARAEANSYGGETGELIDELADRIEALEAAAAQQSQREAVLVTAARELADGLDGYRSYADYEDCAHEDDGHDNDLVTVTRETVELALHALRKMNSEDFYRNSGAAERELNDVLAIKPEQEAGS